MKTSSIIATAELRGGPCSGMLAQFDSEAMWFEDREMHMPFVPGSMLDVEFNRYRLKLRKRHGYRLAEQQVKGGACVFADIFKCQARYADYIGSLK